MALEEKDDERVRNKDLGMQLEEVWQNKQNQRATIRPSLIWSELGIYDLNKATLKLEGLREKVFI